MNEEQEQLYNQFHQKIAFETGLPKDAVHTLRSAILGQKMTVHELIDWCERKLLQTRVKKSKFNRRSHSKKYYRIMLNWLKYQSRKENLDVLLQKFQ